MGLLLSVLLSYVGAVELAFIVRDIVHQIGLHQRRIESNRSYDELERIQQNLRDSLNLARSRSQSCKSDDDVDATIELMQDGVQYENGYRVSCAEDLAATARWVEARNAKINESLSSDDELNVLSDHSTHSLASSSQETSVKTVLENRNWDNVQRETKRNKSSPQSPNSGERLSDESDRTSQLVSPTSSLLNEMPDLHFDEYTDDQMRALDGIKQRSLVRNEGGRNRRAFRKSGSSTSSSDERQELQKSREDELKMFTSLEEEEFEMIRNSDYKPLQYSSEPNLKARGYMRSHTHNRSPIRRLNNSTEDTDGDAVDINSNAYLVGSGSGSDTVGDPWGEVRPGHYRDSDLWKRERAMSIAEDDNDSTNEDDFVDLTPKHFKRQLLPDEGRSDSPVGLKTTKSSSFEAATESDHERVNEMLNNPTTTESANADVSCIFPPSASPLR